MALMSASRQLRDIGLNLTHATRGDLVVTHDLAVLQSGGYVLGILVTPTANEIPEARDLSLSARMQTAGESLICLTDHQEIAWCMGIKLS